MAACTDHHTTIIEPTEQGIVVLICLILAFVFTVSQQFLGLQILEKVVRTRWNALPEDQRAGMSA